MKPALSIRSANGLFLITILLVLTAGSAMQLLNLSAGLIGTEVLVILLPVLVALRIRKIPFNVGLRLNPIRPLTALLCVLLGFSAFLFSAYIDVIMITLTGMASVPVPEGSLPSGAFESLLYFLALAVAAPLCEEALFRGAIQGAYERTRPLRFTIIITALMFAFYHFRLSGLPALLPVAFLLSYIVWRTNSLWAGVLIHFGMNATSAAHTLVALNVNGTGLPILSPVFALAGVAAAAGLVYALQRMHPVPAADPLEPPSETTSLTEAKQSSWWANYWALLVAGLLYLVVAGLTLAAGFLPELSASRKVSFYTPQVSAPQESHYQINNRAGEPVGSLDCTLSPGERIQLDCTRAVQAYEVNLGSSMYAEDDNTATWSAQWDAATLELLAYTFTREHSAGSIFSVELKDGQLIVTSPDGVETLAVAPGGPDTASFFEFEWAWRSNALIAEPGSVIQAPFGRLLRWDEKLQKSVPSLKDELLRVTASEPLDLPAGSFSAWKISFGDQAAWYARDAQGSLRPIQFDDGMTTCVLQ